MAGDQTAREQEPADLSKLLHSIRGDEVLLARLIDNFLGDCPTRLAALGQAFAAGDAAALDQLSHGLRGGLLLLGAEQAAALAAALEALGRTGDLSEAGEALDRLEAECARLVAFLERRRTATP